MTSLRKSLRARSHFYGGYGTFFPALPFLWNSHRCHLGPAWGLALIFRPPRHSFWGSRFRWKNRWICHSLRSQASKLFYRSSDGPNLGPRAIEEKNWGGEFLLRLREKCPPRKLITFPMPISIFDLIVKHAPFAIMIQTYLVLSWDPLSVCLEKHLGAWGETILF